MPCEGCSERKVGYKTEYERARKQGLSGRRAFLAGMAGLLAVTQTQARSLFAGFMSPEESDVNAALNLMRILTVRTVLLKTTTLGPDGRHVHVYASVDKMLGDVEPGLGWLIQSDEVAANLTEHPEERPFWSSLRPHSPTGEIYPGWIVDIDVRTATGYVIVMYRKATGDVLVSDQLGVIYRVRTSDPVLAANTLDAALDYPGGVSFDKFSEYGSRDTTGKVNYILAALSNGLRHKATSAELSACFIGCTGPSPYGCKLTCFFGCMSCPSAGDPCCQENPGMLHYAAKHCGTGDCPWCQTPISHCLGEPTDCTVMRQCYQVVGSLLCCKCPCGVNCN